jgi:hypothetical protein
MMMKDELILTILRQEQPPGYQMCSLSTVNANLRPLSTQQASGIVQLLADVSHRKNFVLTWFVCEDEGPHPSIPLSKEITLALPEGCEAEPIYYAYFDQPDELAATLPTVWDHFGGVQLYPVIDEGDVEKVISPHLNDKTDERRVGMDWHNKWYFRCKRGWIALVGGLCGTACFTAKLLFSRKFRSALLDPFRQQALINIVEQRGAFMFKGGHDENLVLEFMTGPEAIATVAKESFAAHGINLEIRINAYETTQY